METELKPGTCTWHGVHKSLGGNVLNVIIKVEQVQVFSTLGQKCTILFLCCQVC